MEPATPGLTEISCNLRDLAQRLDDIAAGMRPTMDDLAGAPLIDLWEPRLNASQKPAIRGTVFGHPLIGDGQTIRCDLLAADADLAWVMTWAGFYRLGAEKPPQVAEGIRP